MTRRPLRRWLLKVTMLFGPLAIVLTLMPVLHAVELLYPDLVSDWGEHDEYLSDIDDAEIEAVTEISHEGSDLLVVQFDGFVTNIGNGPLRIAGNPQTDSVHQWLLRVGGDPTDPADYEIGSKVTIVYETDDGHNHWHLKNAQEYALWNAEKTEQITVGSKVGFCLYDIDQIRENAGARYFDGATVQFCDRDDPASTNVIMGVSEGWKDVYRSDVSRQWVDVSAVAPGTYWLSVVTDTSDQLAESDETNNGIAFHPDPVIVPGYDPAALSVATAKGMPVDIDLSSSVYGTPGPAGYEVETHPYHGTLTVDGGTVTYTPNPGFSGTDSFEFAVFDTTSPYPTVRPTAGVEIIVANAVPDVTNPGTQTWVEGTSLELTIIATDPDNDPLIYAADGLPEGLRIESGTNTITGTPTTVSSGTATITVTDGDDTVAVDFDWTVGEVSSPPSGGGGGGSAPAPAPAPPPTTSRFDDVPLDHHFFIEITWLAEEAITNGCGPTTFCPEDSMTRAQLASFLVRAFGLDPASTGTDWFEDDNGSVHEDAINALAAAGITSGCGMKTFCPDSPVTRAEWASFLVRALFSQDRTTESDPFTDDNGSVHESSIGVLWDEGLTTGCGPGAYCPDDPVSRGQLAAFLYREFGGG